MGETLEKNDFDTLFLILKQALCTSLGDEVINISLFNKHFIISRFIVINCWHVFNGHTADAADHLEHETRSALSPVS